MIMKNIGVKGLLAKFFLTIINIAVMGSLSPEHVSSYFMNCIILEETLLANSLNWPFGLTQSEFSATKKRKKKSDIQPLLTYS